MIASENSNKDDALKQFLNRFQRVDNSNISSIDMTNEHDIIVVYRNGMIFRMGNWSDVDYKLNLAETVMEDETIKGKKGYLFMIGKKQCSFRSSGENDAVLTATTSPTENGITTETTVVSTAAAYGF